MLFFFSECTLGGTLPSPPYAVFSVRQTKQNGTETLCPGRIVRSEVGIYFRFLSWADTGRLSVLIYLHVGWCYGRPYTYILAGDIE